jgi:hypothetical protein
MAQQSFINLVHGVNSPVRSFTFSVVDVIYILFKIRKFRSPWMEVQTNERPICLHRTAQTHDSDA